MSAKIFRTSILFITILFLITTKSVFSQNSKIEGFVKSFKDAIYFQNFKKEYEQSLSIFLKLDTTKAENLFNNPYSQENDSALAAIKRYKTNIKLHIGECYLKIEHKKTLALPYFEEYRKLSNNPNMQSIHKTLGMLYHANYEFEKAILSFSEYLKLNPTDEHYSYYKGMIEICKNAQQIIASDTLKLKVENIGYLINTKDSELYPLISADDSVLFYNRKPNIENKNQKNTTNEIYVSYKNSGNWNAPEKIQYNFENKNADISLAGIAPNGRILFFRIFDNHNSDIYSCTIEGKICSSLKKLNGNINTSYWEGAASITDDGQELYFSSNRPGGYGKLDLYKSVRQNNGTWGKAINLGSTINSSNDEDAPFIHPNKELLYFSSDGHTTIGGFDIFKTTLKYGKWTKPTNVGFPISTINDNYNFTISASGKKGYFSSSQNDKYNNKNLYSIDYNENIPLTLLKGKIFTDGKPAPTEIIVFDKETNKRVKYAYTPIAETGTYFMIIPPGKNYEIIFKAVGYSPHLVNIYIPNQTSFYQLFQEIHLKSESVLNTATSEEIIVKNTFYDFLKTNQNDYAKMKLLINNIMNATDEIISIGSTNIDKISKLSYNKKDYNKNDNSKVLIDLIKKATQEINNSFFSILEEITEYDEIYSRKYFFALGNKQASYKPIKIGNKLFETLPALKAYSTIPSYIKDFKNQNTKTNLILNKQPKQNEFIEKKQYVMTYQVFFKQNKSTFKKNNYIIDLQTITDLILDNKKLSVEINAFSNLSENKITNKELSQLRLNEVMQFFKTRKVDITKFITKLSWERDSLNSNHNIDNNEINYKNNDNNYLKYLRRVDIKIYDEI